MSKESELLELLTQATDTGKQHWEPTAQEGAFVTVLGAGYSVLIRTAQSGNFDELDYILELRNKEGNLISSIRNEGEGVGYGMLAYLHNTARRAAFKVDESLDAMIKSLKPK